MFGELGAVANPVSSSLVILLVLQCGHHYSTRALEHHSIGRTTPCS
jgi:hypothetical protein